MKIFIDFDGTIVDYKKRFYKNYAELCKHPLSEKEFWKARHKGKSIQELGIKTHKFSGNLEEERLLSFDKLICDKKKLLETKKTAELILVSSRQSKKKLINQLSSFQIDDYFNKVIVTNITKKDKYDALRKFACDKDDFFIGDSEKDIITGQKLGTTTIGVITGLRTKKQLVDSNPDFIFENVNDALDHILKIRN